MRYYLDPDYRKVPQLGKPYCVRCQKVIKDVSKAIGVTVDESNWTVTEGGTELLGADCWKIIQSNPLENS